jgi:hypothetical protein
VCVCVCVCVLGKKESGKIDRKGKETDREAR